MLIVPSSVGNEMHVVGALVACNEETVAGTQKVVGRPKLLKRKLVGRACEWFASVRSGVYQATNSRHSRDICQRCDRQAVGSQEEPQHVHVLEMDNRKDDWTALCPASQQLLQAGHGESPFPAGRCETIWPESHEPSEGFTDESPDGHTHLRRRSIGCRESTSLRARPALPNVANNANTPTLGHRTPARIAGGRSRSTALRPWKKTGIRSRGNIVKAGIAIARWIA
jgi:hypothetical protein